MSDYRVWTSIEAQVLDTWLEGAQAQKTYFWNTSGREPKFLIVPDADWVVARAAGAYLTGRYVGEDGQLELFGMRVVRVPGAGPRTVGW